MYYYLFIYLYICTNELKLWPITANNLVYYLGDNCIVFENFTASIGDLMVAN